MDPLSVAASVVGLITAAAQMSTVLYTVGSAIKDAPQLAQAAARELGDITVVLRQLQQYIEGKAQASIQRLCLITVEHITATLTGCVMTYSELDVILESLHVDTGLRVWDRAMWLLKKDEVGSIVVRLQNHKSTLGLMLNIIQCASLSEAETSMDRLCDTVNKVLQSNEQLSMRLRNIENVVIPPTDVAPSARSIDSPEHANSEIEQHHVPSGDDSSNRSFHSNSSFERPRVSNDISGTHPKASAFEELLHRTRVYRHAAGSHSESSLVDDGRSTLAFSICSSMTLGEVSKISVYALPVYANELSNPACYRFGRILEEPLQTNLTVTPNKQLGTAERTEKDSSVRTPWWKSKRLGRSPQQRRTDKPDVHAAPTDSIAEESPIFGVALEKSIRYANVAISLLNDEGQSYIYGYNPIVVAKCGVFLKEKATEVPHIFETPGSPKRIQELQRIYDSPPRFGKSHNWEGYTVFDGASLLLRYLLYLPEPVVPYDFYEKFVDPIRQFSGPEWRQKVTAPGVLQDTYKDLMTGYQHTIAELPPLNRQLLLYLFDLIAVFASKSDLNLMTSEKLAVLFQHGILRSRDALVTSSELRLSQDALILLIEYQDWILADMKEV